MARPEDSAAHENELADPLPESPLPLLGRWFEEARANEAIRNPDAMALATIDASGHPQVRFVLCRGRDLERARFTFYTHYESAKGRDLDARREASAAFHWDPLARQVRVSGPVARAPTSESDAYFAGRPPDSQLSAWASAQSRPIESREALARALERAREVHGDGSDCPIPRPPGWGGYCIEARSIELWVGRSGRLHDRVRWTREGGEGEVGWRVERLQP